MTLLYADLPERVEPERPDRRRLEALAMLLAGAGAAVAGVGVVEPLLRSRRGPDDEWALSREAPAESIASGVERLVAPVSDAPVLVGPAREFQYAPVDLTDEASAIVNSVPDPAPLPGTGAAPRLVVTQPAPMEIEPIAPVTTVPPATSTTTAVAPATTVPSTTVPTTTVPTTAPTTTVPPPPSPSVAMQQLALTAGFTLTAAMSQTLADTGLEGWVDSQLEVDSVPDPGVDDALVGFDLLDADPNALTAAGLGPVALSQVRWATFVRMIVGERQVHEQVSGLWREFFAVHGDPADLVGLEQTIRRHALGPYVELLTSVLATPAIRRAYALPDRATADDLIDSGFVRDLLERFTLGDSELFDEAEIEGLAIDLASSTAAARTKLAELCSRPETAHHIGGAVVARFLGSPVPAVSGRAHEVFASSGNIGAVVRATLVEGLDHADADRTRSGELWLRAALRSVAGDVVVGGEWNADDPGSIAGMLRALGAEPGTGVSDDDADWETSTAIQARWVVARRLVGGSGVGASVDLGGLVPDPPLPAAVLLDGLFDRLGSHQDDHEREALLIYLGVEHDDLITTIDLGTIADLAALVLSFPRFQRRSGGRS